VNKCICLFVTDKFGYLTLRSSAFECDASYESKNPKFVHVRSATDSRAKKHTKAENETKKVTLRT